MSDETRAAMVAAIEEHLRDSTDIMPAEELGDVVVVAAAVSIDAQYRPCARYFLAFKDVTMLPHVVLGMLSKGEETALGGEVDGDAPS